ncbi:nucleic acid-binding protein [Chloropicon primus]|uniref:Nucleic acid-binding protein n=1 Tax=Chloropicon primus TaxID=1764295 RepID=A0A5B8MDN1_9CHLO|nr:nucleic acid-binding protein [Chloropicon primus]UPQ97572.1 nucleic acid-binding protein [Chloropicon primus]|eukprot:QDZ18361.1 nucleic acid-binding protein [Chloropicon primus]
MELLWWDERSQFSSCDWSRKGCASKASEGEAAAKAKTQHKPKEMTATAEVEQRLAAVKIVDEGGMKFGDLYSAFSAFEQSSATSAAAGGKGGDKGKDKGAKEKGADQAPAGGKDKGGKGGDKEKGKKEKGKKEEKGKKKKAAAAPAAEVDVSILDIRVGKIVEVKPHPEADGLYLEQIDMGEGAPRQIISGLRKFVAIEDMQDREVVVILNLKPAKMRGIMSNGMVLCASNDDHTKVDPLRPPAGVPLGEKVTFEGFEGEPIEVINPKKKLLEKLFPDLKTDADGVAKYKQAAFTTSKGVCTSFGGAWVK